MKLILEKWRKYVSEEVLNEVPLEDFGHVPGRDRHQKVQSKSIGYDQSRDEEYKKKAIEIFSKTDEPWYIIFLEDTSIRILQTRDAVEELIKNKIKNKEWKPNGHFLVVRSVAYQGDSKKVEWQIAHDIIGHSIISDNYGSLLAWGTQFSFKNDNMVHPGLDPKDLITVVAPTLLYIALPRKFRIAMDTNERDVLPDILAAIFFKELDMSSIAKIDFENIDKRLLTPYQNFLNKKILNSLAKESLSKYISVVEKWKKDHGPGKIHFLNPF